MILSAIQPGIASAQSFAPAPRVVTRQAGLPAQQPQMLNLGETRFSNPSLNDSFASMNAQSSALQAPTQPNFGLLCLPLCGAVLALCCLPVLGLAVGAVGIAAFAARAVGKGISASRSVEPE